MLALPRVILAVCLICLSGCGGDGNSVNENTNNSQSIVINVDDEGNTSVDISALEQVLLSYSIGTLDSNEEAGLLLMREEEKLAQDVYSTFANLYAMPIFTNIADSEATHAAAVKVLLDRYSLDDPAATTSAGEFTSDELQTLYNDSVEAGTATVLGALAAGVLIEERDISDLERLSAELTDNKDIALVYSNLQKGSRNHLRSFYARLIENGGSCVPTYISQDEFDEIINSPMETGA